MIPHDAGLPEPSSPLPPPHSRESSPIAGRIESPAHAHRPPAPPPATAPGLSAAPDLFSLLIALRRRWIPAVLLGGTLGAIAGITAWLLLTPKAVAFARLKVDAYRPGVMSDNSAALSDFRTYMETTAVQIISRPVIMGALKRDEVRKLGLDRSETDPVQMIEENVTVETKENSELLTLKFTHQDPIVATTVAQALKNTYMQDFVILERQKRAAQVTTLEKVFNEKIESLNRQKENLKNLGIKLGATEPHIWQAQHAEVVSALRDAKNQQVQIGFKLVESRANLAVHESRMKTMAAMPGGVKSKDPQQIFEDALEDALEADLEAKSLRDRISHQEENITTYQNRGFKPDYISIVSAKKKIESLKELLAKRKDALVAKVKRHVARTSATGLAASDDPAVIHEQLSKQIDSLKALDESLQTDIKNFSALAAKQPTQAAAYEELADTIKRDEAIVKEIGTRWERERVELGAFSRINSWQDADLMKKDIKKQVLATAAAPMAIIFAVCTGLAWMEYRQRRVRTAGEISRGLGIRVVGAVPRTANLEKQLVGANGESELDGTPVMESIDAIRTRLLHEAAARSTRVVMVTSATDGEGKTTLASHLASSLARAGRKTLLLDGDLRHPRLHELFELPMQPGFSEVLLGEVEVAEAAQETHQENLSLIPAGQWDREVLLALSRDGLEGVFERLSDEFDFIIVDSHPVLAATDSLLIGRQVDAVILSVLREVSQMPRVFAAQQQLTGLGVRVLGAVVNGTDPEEVFNAPHATAGAA